MSITNTTKVLALVGLVAIALVSTLLFARSAEANPDSFFRAQSSPATTTLNYLSPGAGTTTLATLDASQGNTFGFGSAALLVQLQGSTTPFTNTNYATTTYRVDFEYSQNGIDWARPVASSTVSNSVGPQGFFITLGETTIGGVKVATTSPTIRIFTVPTPTRFVRPVISIPIGSPSNGAVWGEWVAKKEVQ